jgi:hypothetical protein
MEPLRRRATEMISSAIRCFCKVHYSRFEVDPQFNIGNTGAASEFSIGGLALMVYDIEGFRLPGIKEEREAE